MKTASASPKLTALLLVSAAFCGAFLSVGFSMSVMAPLESTSSTPYTKSAASFGLSSVTDAFAFLHRHHRSWAEQSFRPEDLIIWHGKYKEIRKRLDYNYHAAYNEARISFQDALVDSMLAESTREVRTNCSQPAPWIVFTAGAMGAGKSRTVKLLHQKGRFPLQSFTVVDPDRIRRYLPEFEMLIKLNPEQAGELTRKEAGLIAEVLVQVALDRGHNVLVDGSLRDAAWYQNYFLQLRNDRPDLRIAILHVTAPRDSVFERASWRANMTGRVVPRELLELSMEQVPKSVAILRSVVDFAVDLHNAGADDVEIVTPGVDWETFRTQWTQTCQRKG